MTQETTTTTVKPMSYENNPELGRILALGIKPTIDPPKMMIVVPSGEHLCMQPDGQISIFHSGVYTVCECAGRPMPLPNGSQLLAGLHRDGKSVAIYRDPDGYFYTNRQDRGFVQLRAESNPDDDDRACSSMHKDFFDMPSNPDTQTPIPVVPSDDDD